MIPDLKNKSKRITIMSLEKSETTRLSHDPPLKSIIDFERKHLKQGPFQPDSTTITKNNCKVISSVYKPVIHYLRLIGACPICIEQTNEEIVYSFKLFSWISILNAIVSTSVILFYLFWVADLSHLQHLDGINNKNGIKSEGNLNMSMSSDCKSLLRPFLKRALPMQLSINISLNIVATLTSIPKFVELLSRWSQFENKFQSQLKTMKSPYVTLNSTRDRLAICYLIFASVYCALVSFVRKPCIYLTACTWWSQLFRSAIVIPYAMYTFTEDFKYLFMFRTLEAGFMQVFLKIKEHNENVSKLPEILLPDIVEKWQDLLHDLRQQTRLVSSCSSFHHVVSLSTTFFSLLVGIYFTIIFQFTSAIDEEKSGIVVVALGFCAVGFSRCLVKTNGSERVLNAEKRTVEQLSIVKTGDDVRTQIKINALVELIGRDPAQITILNSFKLNTLFLFQIAGQIATYLIVFLQFDKL